MVHIFEILNDSAFQICLYLFCAIFLSKVISDFVDLGNFLWEVLRVLKTEKMLITFDRMKISKMCDTLL